jgi:putative transposase
MWKSAEFDFEKDLILACVRWYLAYPLIYRNLEERMAERGMAVDRSNIYRWVQKFTPQLDTAFRNGRKRPVSRSWRIDERYIKIKGNRQSKYLNNLIGQDHRAVKRIVRSMLGRSYAVG